MFCVSFHSATKSNPLPDVIRLLHAQKLRLLISPSYLISCILAYLANTSSFSSTPSPGLLGGMI